LQGFESEELLAPEVNKSSNPQDPNSLVACCVTVVVSITDQDGTVWSGQGTCCISDVCAVSEMCAENRADANLQLKLMVGW
jgi:hypothetical protein